MRRKCSAGMNLIETAIVLGVIGLVIGGIWVAASSISYNMKLRETSRGMLSALQAVRQLYGTIKCPGSVTTITPWEINIGVASQWPRYTAGGARSVYSPLGPPMEVSVRCGTSYGDAITISLGQGTWDLTEPDCQNMNVAMGLKNPTGFPLEDGNFIALGGTGRCTTVISAGYVTWYFKY